MDGKRAELCLEILEALGTGDLGAAEPSPEQGDQRPWGRHHPQTEVPFQPTIDEPMVGLRKNGSFPF